MESPMNAGRDLDALVAERVMGWVHHPEQILGMPPSTQAEFWTYMSGESRHHVPAIPSYSTSLAAAWEVVEKFRGFEIIRIMDQYVVHIPASILKDDYLVEGIVADTAPLAICLAALKAVEKT